MKQMTGQRGRKEEIHRGAPFCGLCNIEAVVRKRGRAAVKQQAVSSEKGIMGSQLLNLSERYSVTPMQTHVLALLN